MNLLVRFQFECCAETLWTFIANIQLHTFMSFCMCCLRWPLQLNFFPKCDMWTNCLHRVTSANVKQETAKLSVVSLNLLMRFQFKCCAETLWTFIANIQLHTFISLHVLLEVTFAAKLLPKMWHVNQLPTSCDFSQCVFRIFSYSVYTSTAWHQCEQEHVASHHRLS